MATVIRGGKRFDSVAGRFEPNGALLIDDGVIAAIDGAVTGQHDEIDATGKTVMPGLMNLHGHPAWDAFSDLEAQTRFDGPLGYIKAARGLRASVEAGFTTVRTLGCLHDTGLVARQAVELGLLAGPTIVACGRAVCRTGGHIWWGNREADGPDEVRKAVREQARAGVDWIKVMAHGYSRAETEAAVDQAHEEGLPITTDAGAWAEVAVDAGIDCIEHGGNYSDELIGKIVEQGIWIVPTLSPVVLQARNGAEWGMKQSVIDRRLGQLHDSGRHEGLVRARKAGARLAFGTDSGSPVVPHDTVLPELEALLEFGVFEHASEALQAATHWAAECLRIDDRTGSLRQGYQADVAIFDGDVEADLSAIVGAETVFVKGRLTVRDGASRLPDPRDFQTFVGVGA
jgi:imidazolonepropionase-like amidohydrolase